MQIKIDEETDSYEYGKSELLVGATKGVVVDIETTGLTANDEIITLGFVSGNTISIFQRKSLNAKPFYSKIKEVLLGISKPLYAYNSRFEEKFFKRELEVEIEVIDLMEPWRNIAEKHKMKWPKLDELVTEPEIYFNITRISSKHMPTLWRGYLSSGENTFLELIMKHNSSDLLRELYLLVQYPHLYSLEDQETKTNY